MPMSDDELDSSSMQGSQIQTMSKAELRKSHKPIMEKRRRARINQCLNEIKNLILEAMNKDPARHTKLEKADILEMAVKHLQNVQRQHLALAMATDPSVIRKFKGGFNDCASEIDRFINKSDNIDNGIKDRVSTHLQKCINGLEQVVQFSNPNLPFVTASTIFSANQNLELQGGGTDQSNNTRIQMPQGIQLIPSRLPTGELALLVPNSSNLPYFPSQTHAHRPSAFITVTPQTMEPPKPLSPPLSPQDPICASPKGFRPVQANLPRPKASYPGEDHQVPQISSTVGGGVEKHHFSNPMELKTMKFPIHKSLDKERKTLEHTSVIKKLSEPLCVITNQGERYRQAQQKEESVFLEENQVPPRGVKRDYSEMVQHQGILTTVSQEPFARPSKIVKTAHHVVPSSTYVGRSSSEILVSLPYSYKDKTLSYSSVPSKNPQESSYKNKSSSYSSVPSKNLQEFSSLKEELPQLERLVPLEGYSKQFHNNNNNEVQENAQKNESNDMWRPW